jgi:hypothetical protein
MFDETNNRQLTPDQEKVIAAIVRGATLQAAAEAAGVHRNTIAYWRRISIGFRESLIHAQYDKAIAIREEAEKYAAEAWAAIAAILNDPKTSASVRLNAAKYVIEKASTPPPPEPEAVYRLESAAMPGMHKDAQSDAQTAHSNAQSFTSNVGRNTHCPCGSGLKFKRCCLGKPQAASAPSAAVV